MTEIDTLPGDEGQDDGDAMGLAQLADLLEQAPAGRLVKGQFSIYKTDEGGLHIAYRLDGQDADGHLPVPARALHLCFMAASGKGPFGMLAKMAGRL